MEKITKTFLKKPAKKETKKILLDNGFEEVYTDKFSLPFLTKYKSPWRTEYLIELGTIYIYIANEIVYNPEGKVKSDDWYNRRLELCNYLKIPQIIFNEEFIQMYKKYVEKQIRTLELTNISSTEFEEDNDNTK